MERGFFLCTDRGGPGIFVCPSGRCGDGTVGGQQSAVERHFVPYRSAEREGEQFAQAHFTYGMSDQLREHSHGHNLAAMIGCAERCIRLAQAHGLVVRFSSLFMAAHRTSPGAASPARLRPSSLPSLCSGISAHTPKRPAWSTPLKQRSPPVSARPTSAAAQRWLMSVNQSLLPCKPKHGAFRHHLYIRYDHSAQVIHRFHARRGVIHGSPLCSALPSRESNE